jgi:hypothetical protein
VKNKIILILIILIPSLIYFLFELSEANFKKMAFYGPKTVDAKGDTVYYTLPEKALAFNEIYLEKGTDGSGTVYFTAPFNDSSANKDKAFIAILLKPGFKEKISGVLEYEKYKASKIKEVPIMLVNTNLQDLPDLGAAGSDKRNYSEKYLKDSLGISLPNFHLVFMKDDAFWKGPKTEFDYSVYTSLFFNRKPVHVFDYFAVLVDKGHHIRGYYDPTYVAEVKRMIEEYKHLVLKDEHAEMQKNNAIEQK